jgi:hypothetical protein
MQTVHKAEDEILILKAELVIAREELIVVIRPKQWPTCPAVTPPESTNLAFIGQ